MRNIYRYLKLKLCILLGSCALLVQAQREFGFKYVLKPKKFNDITIYERGTGKTKTRVYKGFIQKYDCIDNCKDTLSLFAYSHDSIAQRKLNANASCDIKKTADTLFLSFWYFKGNREVNRYNFIIKTSFYKSKANTDERLRDKNSAAPVPINSDNGYYILLNDETLKSLSIRHRQSQLTAISLPFRVNLKNGDFQSNFLNVNASFNLLWGRTRFYRSKFLRPRNYVGGIGPYLGFGAAGNNSNSRVFALNYGLDFIFSLYNFQIIPALGLESRFDTSKNFFTPYVGVGLGFKLADLAQPGGKD
jgi:hypothetical protein